MQREDGGNVLPCLSVVQPLSQALRVDADVEVAALIHELQVRRTVNPGGVADESQVQLQRDTGRVLCGGHITQSITHGYKLTCAQPNDVWFIR